VDSGLIAIEAAFSRCVSRKRDPLSAEGARLMGGRFNPMGCPALYLASTPTLAVAEALQLGSIYGVVRFNPRLLVSIDVSLSSVLDLTTVENLERTGFTLTDLQSDWRGASEPTAAQRIGFQARDAGVEAILFPSRIEPQATNLCVFRENLLSTSQLAVDGYDDVWPDC